MEAIDWCSADACLLNCWVGRHQSWLAMEGPRGADSGGGFVLMLPAPLCGDAGWQHLSVLGVLCLGCQGATFSSSYI